MSVVMTSIVRPPNILGVLVSRVRGAVDKNHSVSNWYSGCSFLVSDPKLIISIFVGSSERLFLFLPAMTNRLSGCENSFSLSYLSRQVKL